MDSEHYLRCESGPTTNHCGQRVNDALNDLVAYALNLDSEYHRFDKRLHELAESGSASDGVLEVLRERAELAEELNAYRRAVTAFRDEVLRGD